MDRKYTNETPRDFQLTGSSNAGGSAYITETGVAPVSSGIAHFFREYGSREEHSFFNTRGLDHQHKPPKWMEHKDVAIDGSPLAPASYRAEGYWQKVYEKELAIGSAIAANKQRERFETNSSIIGGINKTLRALNFMSPATKEIEISKALTNLAQKNIEDEVIDSLGGGKAKPEINNAWETLLVSAETNRSVVKVAQQYRPRVDFFGIDTFLDNSLAFMWYCTKIGMFIGLAQGTIRTISVVNVDAQFLRASGVGVLALLNVTVFANVIKWGGNIGVFSAAFCAGDRLAAYGKQYAYPQHDAQMRSMSNYSCGLSLACATIGTLPWWMLNDKRFAVRLAVAGSAIGAVLGMFIGHSMEKLVSLNLSRLDATPRDMRRFEAIMKRENIWLEHLKNRYRDHSKILLF